MAVLSFGRIEVLGKIRVFAVVVEVWTIIY